VIDPGTRRAAVAAEPHTTILAVGGPPGSALSPSPYEFWYAAQPAYDAGDYDRAYNIASEGLTDHPHHGPLHYQLACYRALGGDPQQALDHLRVALDNDEGTRWAADDEDLDALRELPGFRAI